MKKFLFLIALLFSGLAFSQSDEEKIEWNQDRPLTWADFKAEPPANDPYEANTNSGISYSWTYSTSSGRPDLRYEVHTYFYPELSWSRELEEEDYILAHEQLHFDISELYARKLRKELEEYEIGRNIRRDLRNIYNKIEQEREAMEKAYDAESNHSKNREAEFRWRKMIAKKLSELQQYSS
ncbi:MAG: DUF922 domain-containing protein [Salegentibacter sp.]